MQRAKSLVLKLHNLPSRVEQACWYFFPAMQKRTAPSVRRLRSFFVRCRMVLGNSPASEKKPGSNPAFVELCAQVAHRVSSLPDSGDCELYGVIDFFNVRRAKQCEGEILPGNAVASQLAPALGC
jgi:hypothetical protein